MKVGHGKPHMCVIKGTKKGWLCGQAKRQKELIRVSVSGHSAFEGKSVSVAEGNCELNYMVKGLIHRNEKKNMYFLFFLCLRESCFRWGNRK